MFSTGAVINLKGDWKHRTLLVMSINDDGYYSLHDGYGEVIASPCHEVL